MSQIGSRASFLVFLRGPGALAPGPRGRSASASRPCGGTLVESYVPETPEMCHCRRERDGMELEIIQGDQGPRAADVSRAG
jgi:hypothetical protein